MSSYPTAIFLPHLPGSFTKLVRARETFISLPSTARLPVKMPNFTFSHGRKQAMTKFIPFMNLDMVNSNSAPEDFACI